jgi:nucleotide-binding universal stress UspA family protein
MRKDAMTRVLVPVDDSKPAERACDLALELFPEGTIVLLHVINPAEASYISEAAVPGVAEEWYSQRRQDADELLHRLQKRLPDTDAEIRQQTEIGPPAGTIVDCIEDGEVDHVVMGSRGRQGVSRLLLGSVAETVVRRSPAAVTIAR